MQGSSPGHESEVQNRLEDGKSRGIEIKWRTMGLRNAHAADQVVSGMRDER